MGTRMQEHKNQEAEVKVKSLQKALGVLNCFLFRPSLSLTEISEMMRIYKSNAHNILSTLLSMGYVEKDAETGRYRLGLGIYRLSKAMDSEHAIDRIAMPIIRELANSVSESVVLCLPQGEDVLYIAGEIPGLIGFSGKPYFVGYTAKMYCTSSGKAMLAFMDEAERNRALPEKLEAQTEFTITDRAVLDRELEEIRRRGYATDHMECVNGLSCLAYPVCDESGKVLASLTITGPSPRIESANTPFLVQELLRCGKKLTNLIRGN